jgi:hypothetical protein
MDGELELLGERIAEQAAHLDAAMHRLLADLREFDERGGWHVQGAMSCAHWLAWRVGWDLVTARERVRVARKLSAFPAIDGALQRGEVSYSKVRALVRVATPANEALLLDHARLMTASQLEKLSRKYALVQRHGQDPHPLDDQQRRYVCRRDTEDGMVKIEAVLHPEEAELIWTMLDHAAAQLVRAPEPLASEDSGESPEPAHALGAAVSSPHGDAVTGGLDDSAESTVVTRPSGPVDDASLPKAARRGSDDSAESREFPQPRDSTPAASPGAAGGSMIDRWLDEAEMYRGVDAERDGEHEASSTAPISGRPASVLHQRADAARRAFNRADALVALAQGYLRGDRPHRSPVEITLTIPEVSLRAGVTDPVEVGELGESFLAGQAARGSAVTRVWSRSSRTNTARLCRSAASGVRSPARSSARCTSAIRHVRTRDVRTGFSWKDTISNTGPMVGRPA